MTEIRFPKIEIEPADLDRLENIVKRFEIAAKNTISPEIDVRAIVPLGNCTWSEDTELSTYATECGEWFNVDVGTPADNGMKFCPLCGRHLVVSENENKENANGAK